MHLTCEGCGVEFEGKRFRRFCERSCQVATYRRNNPVTRTSTAHNVRVAPDLFEDLAREAEARGVSVAWLVARLLEEALDGLAPAEEFSLTSPRA